MTVMRKLRTLLFDVPDDQAIDPRVLRVIQAAYGAGQADGMAAMIAWHERGPESPLLTLLPGDSAALLEPNPTFEKYSALSREALNQTCLLPKKCPKVNKLVQADTPDPLQDFNRQFDLGDS